MIDPVGRFLEQKGKKLHLLLLNWYLDNLDPISSIVESSNMVQCLRRHRNGLASRIKRLRKTYKKEVLAAFVV